MFLKKEYLNTEVKRGQLVFDTAKVHPKHYKIYSENGFEDLFESKNEEKEDKIPVKGVKK